MSLMHYDQALKQLLESFTAVDQQQSVALMQAQGRVLAQDIVAQQDSPRFDNSAMDGYAICGVDCAQWQVVDYIAAGDSTQHQSLSDGQAVRIFTGAAVPKGADAVLPQEDVFVDEDWITAKVQVRARQHIRFRAEEYAQGAILIDQNQSISATHIGIMATQGFADVLCYRQVTVTVFSTGNELQQLGQPLQENQIYDSNRFMVMALAKEYPFLKVIDGGVLPDDLQAIQQQLDQAAKTSDVILLSGGASVGDKDYTRVALDQLGTIQHWKLAIKPGKPFGWGEINHSKVFLLPGNPVACWVTLLILVLPALKVLSGIKQCSALPQVVQAEAQFSLDHPQSRQQFLLGQLDFDLGKCKVNIHPFQSSAMLANCGKSNALVMVPAQQTVVSGQQVSVMYLQKI